jgi:hypothetical protein
MYIILGHVRMGNLNDLRIRDSVEEGENVDYRYCWGRYWV